MHCFARSGWKGVVRSKIKTSSFIVKHSWAVWSLSPRVIGVCTACGFGSWAAHPHAQSPPLTCLGHHLSPPNPHQTHTHQIQLVFKVLPWTQALFPSWENDDVEILMEGRHTVCYQVHKSKQKWSWGLSSPLHLGDSLITFHNPPFNNGGFLIQLHYHRLIFSHWISMQSTCPP